MLDTRAPTIVGKLGDVASLLAVELGGDGGMFAPLDDSVRGHKIPLENWWRQVVIRFAGGTAFSRKSLVLNMSDTDGGAHVDPEIDASYFQIKDKGLGIEFISPRGKFTPRNIHLLTIRQVGHEVLRSFGSPCHPSTAQDGGRRCVILQGHGAVLGVSAKKVQRNEPCPCQSGLKFKKCHDRP